MPAPPLYIQEKVQPLAIIRDLQVASGERQSEDQPDLFADFNGLPPDADKMAFYQHDANWSNRMILGDSLQVMASLANREGLRGKVQCIYMDPPYGIKFNSNFQWSTTSRDVKDGKSAHVPRQPEQVRAYRDTWHDGIHSYLSYLRDRLVAARDLLTPSGSVFVQIGDENVHRVRAVMDEVFGPDNFVSCISSIKTSGFSSNLLSNISDYILWYSKSKENGGGVKYRHLLQSKKAGDEGATGYQEVGSIQSLRQCAFDSMRLVSLTALTSPGATERDKPVYAFGREFFPGSALHWKTNEEGLRRLAISDRIAILGRTLRYVRFLDDFSVYRLHNTWTDTSSSFMPDKVYICQTLPKVIQRCLLMTTDPGDLVLDPTCGSGTTAFVAEQWGRRWITIDTSRVALTLARARIMAARYPYYLLADSREGRLKKRNMDGQNKRSGGKDDGYMKQEVNEDRRVPSIKQGFVYRRVPHVTLKSIANNAEIDVIWEKHEKSLAQLRQELSAASGQWSKHEPPADGHKAMEEWEVPRDFPKDWPEGAKGLHKEFWDLRIARQREMDASIAANASYETLYDKPYEDKKKVRVAGPFTMESLSPHRMLGVDANDELIAPSHDATGFTEIILEHLKSTGVQQAYKEDRITFSSLMPRAGQLVCAEGTYVDGEGKDQRAGIFIGPEFGTVSRRDLTAAEGEAADAGYDVLIACAFSFEALVAGLEGIGRIPILKAHMNADLHMARDLKNAGQGNLFVVFGEPDIAVTSGIWLSTMTGMKVANYESVKSSSGLGSLEEINQERPTIDGLAEKDYPLSLTDNAWTQVTLNGVDVFQPNSSSIRSDGPEGIACWFIDTNYNEDCFFIRHAYFLGAKDPYNALKRTLKAEINEAVWESLHSNVSRPFECPSTGKIAVKAINHLGDEVMKVFVVSEK